VIRPSYESSTPHRTGRTRTALLFAGTLAATAALGLARPNTADADERFRYFNQGACSPVCTAEVCGCSRHPDLPE